MKKGLLFLMMLLTTVCSVNATTYYSIVSGHPGTLGNWRANRDGTGATPGGFGVSGDIFIIQGTGGMSGAPHTMTSSSTWTTIGTGVTVTVEGGATLQQNSNITFPVGSTFRLLSGAIFNQNSTNATNIVGGTEDWQAGSTVVLLATGVFSSANVSGGYPNLTFNNNGSTTNCSSNLTQINGNLTVISGSGNRLFRFAGNTGDVTVTVGGNVSIQGTGTGGLDLTSATTSAGKVTLNIGGNLSISAGVLNISGTSPNAVSSINFTGGGTASSFSQTGGTVTTTLINWSVANSPTGKILTLNNNLTNSASRTMTVASGATLATTGSFTNSGTTTINGSFQINQGGFASGTNFVYGSAGTLIFNNTTGAYGVSGTPVFWPTSSGPANVTVQGGGGINMSIARTVPSTGTTGTFLLVTGSNAVQGTALTLNGTTQINGGNFQSTPTYGSSSTLIYNNGSTYNVSNEWTGAGITPGSGVPQNVTVQNNTAFTATGARGLGGVLTVAAGASFATGGTLAVGGSASIDGTFQINQSGFATGTFSYGSAGTLVWNNTSGVYGPVNTHTYFPSSASPFNVSVLGAGGVDFGSITRTVAGAFSVSATISNYCNLTFNGSVALNSGYNFSGTCGAGLPVYACNSTLNYNSGGTPARGGEWGSGTTPGGISITNNTTFNGNSGTASICGDLNIASGSSLYMDFGGSGASALNVGGNVTLAGNLSLGFGVGGDMTVGGNWTHTTGTFNTNSRLVTFNGASGNQTITNAGGETFSFLTVNKALGDVVLGGNVTVSNTLDLTAGNLSIAANTLTLGAAFSRTSGNLVGGNTSGLTVNAAAGSLYFASGSTNNYLKALTIGASGSATLANDLNITAYDGVSAEGALTVTSGGTLTTGGFLTIKSSANGTGRIAAGNTAGGYISGNVTVERFIPQNSSKGWRLLASNTSGQTINAAWQEGQADAASNTSPGFGTQISSGNALGYSLATAQTNGFDALSTGVGLFKYDPATDVLNPVNNTSSTSLASEPGYFIFIRGDRSGGGSYGAGAPTTSTVLRSTGSVFQGNQTAVSTGAQNYGLVRNAYPSRIDMRQIVRGGSLIDAYQVWDSKLGGAFGVGGYQTFAKSGSDYIVTPGGGSYGSNGSVHNFIESGAAFFIQSSGGSGTAQLVEACKTSASSIQSFRPATPLAGEAKVAFNLYADNGSSIDAVDGGLTFFNTDYSNAVDISDVRKSLNFNENFGTKRSNIDLVVERKEPLNVNDTIFFSMNQLRKITYRLDIEATNIDPLITTAVLEDKYTNIPTVIDLSVINAYTFIVNTDSLSQVADRFRLVFRQATVVPVTFVSIKAAQVGNNIGVEWNVANETNVKYYEVQKSTNGISFSTKGTVGASGLASYNWLDNTAVNGYNYYRIKSVDNNGQVKYSVIAKVQIGGKAGIAVYPNPIQGNFVNVQFNGQQAGKYGIRITNIAGQAVYNKEVTHNGGSASQSFALSSQLVTGVYQMEVIAPDNSRHIEKIIINKGN